MTPILALVRPALSSLEKKLTRALVLYPSAPFMAADRRVRLERWLRGREQCEKLARADIVIVSFGKSGRTWLRVMLSRFYQLRHGLSERFLIGFDNYHFMNRDVPRIFFTHDNYVKDYSGNVDSKADYYGKKVVLLVRHPADVAVSQYHQWRFRMRPRKKVINDYPSEAGEVSIFDFVRHEAAGLQKTIDFLNGWARERERLGACHILRYEDMREDPAGSLRDLLAFMGTPGTPAQIEGAVEYASFDNMKKLESQSRFWLSGGRMKAKDKKHPQSFKVRRGKVGGFRDYFSDDEVESILDYVDAHLDPVFGYRRTIRAPSEAHA